jgi:hypothetical protein
LTPSHRRMPNKNLVKNDRGAPFGSASGAPHGDCGNRRSLEPRLLGAASINRSTPITLGGVGVSNASSSGWRARPSFSQPDPDLQASAKLTIDLIGLEPTGGLLRDLVRHRSCQPPRELQWQDGVALGIWTSIWSRRRKGLDFVHHAFRCQLGAMPGQNREMTATAGAGANSGRMQRCRPGLCE